MEEWSEKRVGRSFRMPLSDVSCTAQVSACVFGRDGVGNGSVQIAFLLGDQQPLPAAGVDGVG